MEEVESLSALFKSIFDEQKEDFRKMTASARCGDVNNVQTYFKKYHTYPYLGEEKKSLVQSLIADPDKYAEKEKLARLLIYSQSDASIFFIVKEQYAALLESDLWSMWSRSPYQDTAEAAAILLAEFIRYKKTTTAKPYQMPLANLLSADSSLTSADQDRKIRESIITTQNALCEYVAREGAAQPMNKAPAFLHFMAGEEDAALWTLKIDTIKIRMKYSVEKGDITTYGLNYS